MIKEALLSILTLLSPGVSDSVEAPTITAGDTLTIGEPIMAGKIPLGVSQVGTCSLGPILSDTRAITAGHCGSVGDTVYASGVKIGTLVDQHPTKDLIHIDLNGVDADVTPLDPRGGFHIGMPVWKSGATTGHTEGAVVHGPVQQTIVGESMSEQFGYNVPGALSELDESTRERDYSEGYLADMCVEPGDSGAAVFSDQGAVGIVSGVSAYGCDESTVSFLVELD